ncbi:PD-(D/E)XK motif protein [Micromonospora sp. CP22]|uniref:PD-(D/E)XK motif protein n=1 Tax=Micromonospora sp. CP22 TaxID=2580517 RepID=UPI0012BBB6AE|nr:PD-(D/E)XK motif protein [Micromonospora sp. CP22]MTK05410.1 PD-(D/E)XK motif protein [Micromonospora sp. CP22]
MTDDAGGRHLSRDALEKYLAGNAPAALMLPGAPYCRVIIEPGPRRIVLRTPRQVDDTVDVTGFEYVTTRTVAAEGATWSELVVDHGGQGVEAYLLISDVADLMQLRGLSFGKAVRTATATFQDLLSNARGLPPEKQTGLYGELLFVESCLDKMSPAQVLDAWHGYTRHEHDFVFPGACFEVKSTRSERRRHRISGLEQLQPVPNTTLWLLSIQLTSSTPEAGRSLAELVDDVRDRLGADGDRFETMLAELGWRERDRSLYRNPLTLRAPATAYPIDDGFPVLDRSVVDSGCARPELIIDVDYTIDLTSLQPGTPPAPADRFVEGND